MTSKSRKGPAPRGDETRSIDQLPSKIVGRNSALEMAEQAIAEMIANGAWFAPTLRSDGSPGFTYEIAGAGDLQRCRAIINKARQRPEVWLQLVAMVANETDQHAKSA